LAVSRGAEAVPGSETNVEVDGKIYPQNLAIKCLWNGRRGEDPLNSAQRDLSEEWAHFRYVNDLEDETPSFLKTASGECPHLVKQMLQNIIDRK
jgi:hypothetical protein